MVSGWQQIGKEVFTRVKSSVPLFDDESYVLLIQVHQLVLLDCSAIYQAEFCIVTNRRFYLPDYLRSYLKTAKVLQFFATY